MLELFQAFQQANPRYSDLAPKRRDSIAPHRDLIIDDSHRPAAVFGGQAVMLAALRSIVPDEWVP